jgi:putative nucleotidyltransferase with HDIG domain
MVHRAAVTSRDSPPAARLGDILTGLSHALDISEGHPRGHAARACLIGMRLAHITGLRLSDRTHLFYALLLKDAGCSSNAARVHELFGGDDHEAKRAIWTFDWRNFGQQAAYVYAYASKGASSWQRLAHLARIAAAGPGGRKELVGIRCDRGADIAIALGLSQATADGIRSMDEHWDGGGEPGGLRGADIPLAGRIVGLAQVAEVFWHDHDEQAALDVAERRSARWFDPDLVRAFRVLAKDREFWSMLRTEDTRQLAFDTEHQFAEVADEARIDAIADTFAAIIDAKSPYTHDHSRRVAALAVTIAQRLGFSAANVTRIRRAALLHDIGKLGVPNSILDKAGGLSDREWAVVREHPAHTLQILEAVPVFQDFAFDASCHHERLDGSGYPRGYQTNRLSPTARALAVADMAEALLAERPYRARRDPDEALRILKADCARGALCRASVFAIADVVASGGTVSNEATGKIAAAIQEQGSTRTTVLATSNFCSRSRIPAPDSDGR